MNTGQKRLEGKIKRTYKNRRGSGVFFFLILFESKGFSASSFV